MLTKLRLMMNADKVLHVLRSVAGGGVVSLIERRAIIGLAKDLLKEIDK